jgi:hypothetical protein
VVLALHGLQKQVGPYVYRKVQHKVDVWWDHRGQVSAKVRERREGQQQQQLMMMMIMAVSAPVTNAQVASGTWVCLARTSAAGLDLLLGAQASAAST